jgi:hypothetical protein
MNSNKQQTAVEWFAERIQSDKIFNFEKVLEQAKEMEKERQEKLSESWAKSREQTRETAMHIGFVKGFMSGFECYEDYHEKLNRTQLDENEFTRNYIVDEFEKTYGGN